MGNKLSENWMSPETESKYFFAEDDLCAAWYVGVLAYAENEDAVQKSPLEIAHMAIKDELDYNKFFGFFKIVVVDKTTGTTYFWGDNSGSKRFYYSQEQGVFADTLPACVRRLTSKILPCYEAIYQYLTIERAIDGKTIIDGVLVTSKDSVYILTNGRIIVKSKELLPFTALDRNFRLEKLMKILTAQLNPEQISAVTTGGTDSRSILAHLVHLGISPNLLITGRDESEDVKIAKKIADTLHLSIDVYNPEDKEPNWLQRAFEFSNGVYDVVLCYRHLRKAELCCSRSENYEFGGVGGEYYKNSFSHPFRYAQPFKPLTAKSIIDHSIGSTLSCKAWFGKDVAKVQNLVYNNLHALISPKLERGFLRNYNIFGNEMLTGTFSAITDSLTPFCTKIDPLMNRNLIASVCYRNWITLSMARWQRREIFSYCPLLSEIETDQGYSCSVRPGRLLLESLKILAFYFKLALNKVKRILLKKSKNEISLWNQDYVQARLTPEYIESVNICRRLGIISEEYSPDSLPMDKTGFILMIGMFFKQYGGM